MMNVKKILESFKKNFFIITFVTITFSLLLYRISLHADRFDEIFNLAIPYRVALGQLPFYECWDSFQSGDILLAPFLYLFISIIGSSGGIVFFSRLLYICTLIFVSAVFYCTINKYIEKRIAFLISYIFCFFQVYSLFYLWYDTFSIVLLILGTLYTFKGMMEQKYCRLYMLLAGLFHGLMAFSYPTFVMLAVFYLFIIIIYTMRKKKPIIYPIYYILGGGLVLLLFFTYVVTVVGIDNFRVGIETILSYRSIVSEKQNNLFIDIISSYFIVNNKVIIPSIIWFIMFKKTLKKEALIFPLTIGIVLTALFNHLLVAKESYGLANFMAYIALWGPCFYIIGKQKNKKLNNGILIFLWIPSILSSICIAISTIYAKQGPTKCWQAFILAGMVTIWLMAECIMKSDIKAKNLFLKVGLGIISCMMLFNSYFYIYLNQPRITISDTRMKEGIYKYIKVNSTMEPFLDIQNMVLEYTKDKHTILAGNNLRPIYLMTDLLPCVPTTVGPCYFKDEKWTWEMSIKYFRIHDKYPDIMFLEPFEIDDFQIQNLLNQKYTLVGEEYIGEFDILIYEHK